MFRRVTLFTGMVLGIVFLIWGFGIGWVQEKDILRAKRQFKSQKLAKSTTLFSAAEQKRKGVVKEIWFSQDSGERLHHRICSDASLLMIVPVGNKLDLIEKLQNIHCWMQDKLYVDSQTKGVSQQLRFFKAQEGFYKYSSQEFLAQSVDLSLYRLEGKELPSQNVSQVPFLRGIAQDVSFSMSGKTSQFKAQQFKAELNSFEEKK